MPEKTKNNIISRCFEEIDRIKKQFITLPVTVIIPHSAYITAINKAIARAHTAYINLHIKTLTGYILDKIEPQVMVSGERRVESLEEVSIIEHIILENNLEYFAEVKEFSSIPELFRRAMNNISLSGNREDIDKALANMSKSPKGRDIAVVYNEYIKVLDKNGLISHAQVLDIFLSADKKSADIPSNDTVILFPWIEENLSYKEHQCLDKIKSMSNSRDLEPCFPEIEIEFNTSPFEKVEASHAGREIIDLAGQGIRFEDMAVICPNRHYMDIVQEVFTQAGIPAYLAEGGSSSYIDSFQVFHVLMDIYNNDYEFNSMKKLLLFRNSFDILRAARDFGAAEGYDNWIHNIAAHLSEAGDDKEKERISKLREFIEVLGKFNNRFMNENTYEGYLKAAIELIDEVIYRGKNKNILLSLIRNLNITSFGRKAGLEDFLELLNRRLGCSCIGDDDKQGRVCVTSVINPGIYDYVFAPGLTESNYPKQFRQDPILLDEDIIQLNRDYNLHMYTSMHWKQKEEQRFDLLLHSAGKKIFVSFPHMEILESREIFQTPFFYRIFERIMEGKPKFTESISMHKQMLAYIQQRNDDSSIFQQDPLKSLNAFEYETGLMMDRAKAWSYFKHYAAEDKGLLNMYLSEHARWRVREFNNYTGIVSKNMYEDGIKLSATTVSDFLQCPYMYFLKKKIYLEPAQDLQPGEMIEAWEMGEVVHAILEKAMTIVRDEKLPKPEYGKVLDRVKKTELKEYIDTHELHNDLIWEKRVQEVEQSLEYFLEYEEGNQNALYEFELTFGLPVEGSFPLAELKFKDMNIKLRGKIDRVDQLEDGGYCIMDYKYSLKYNKYNMEKQTTIDKIQLLLYAQALRKIKSMKAEDNIRLGFFTIRDSRKPVIIREPSDTKAKLDDIFDYMKKVMKKGYFYQSAKCEYCNYMSVCTSLVETQVKVKLEKDQSGLIATFNKIREYK